MNQKPGSFLQRYAAAILAAFALATPLVLYGAVRAINSNTNKVVDWLPKSYAETEQLRWFRERFTGDQFIIISWDGCRLGGDPQLPNSEPDDPRIERLARTLVPAADQLEQRGQAGRLSVGPQPQYFQSVTTGRRLLTYLTSPPMNLPYEVAVSRLTGTLIGPDGQQTCVLVMLTDEAIPHFSDVVGRGDGSWLGGQGPEGALFTALRECDIDPDSVHLGGPPVDNVAIDDEGERTLMRLAGLAGVVGALLAWWSLRSVKLTLIVFACGLLSAAASLAAVWLTGQTTDAVLLSMPALVYVLAISGAIHLINYYRDAVQECGLERAPERAMAHGWKPALFCSVTTALGLLSLCASDLTPIRNFGIFSALGVMLTLIVLFVMLPAALEVCPIRSWSRVRPVFERQWRLTEFWQQCGAWIIRRHEWVTAACVVLAACVGLGVTHVRTSIDLMKLFDEDARILQDYRWLESHLGQLVPMEVVLRFGDQSLRRGDGAAADEQRYSLLDRAEIVAAVHRAIETRFGPRGDRVIGPLVSPVTFIPPLPKQRQGTSAVVRRSITNSKLQRSFGALQESGYLRMDPVDGAELWRISVRVAAFKNVDYGRFADELRRVVDPIVEQHNRSNKEQRARASLGIDTLTNQPPPLTAIYTGVVPIVYKAQRALLDSLINSTVWSFLTITPLLMFVSRGIRRGMVAMLPNVLPVLVVFGGMGWLGRPVDIGSMMSASIALGVAVDDTIHYLTWFRDELNRTGDRNAAILAAYRRCATPTLQAALISGLGLSVFAFSTFTPTKQFGFLMLTILLAGVVAELIMLPALLAGPLGRVFQPSQGKRVSCLESETGPRGHMLQRPRRRTHRVPGNESPIKSDLTDGECRTPT